MESFKIALRRDPVLWAVTALVAIVHLGCAGRFDFFRDELYFIICGRHPDYGYADQPAIIPLLSAATQIFGENLFLLRLPAVLAAILIVPLTGAFARLLGGNRTAVALAGTAVALSPVLSGLDATLFTSSFDALTWTALAYFLMRAVLREERNALLWAGLIAGIAFETKYTVSFWLMGMAVGLVLMPERRLLAWRSLWLGLLIAAVLAAPAMIWQTLHGWPFFELSYHHYAGVVEITPYKTSLHQVLITNPFLAPLWLSGLIAPFVIRALKPARFLAIAFPLTFAIIIATHGKDYYQAGAYPTLFAIGSVAVALWVWWLRAAIMTGAVIVSLLLAPLILPILDPPLMVSYIETLHLRPRMTVGEVFGAHMFNPRLDQIRAFGVPLMQLSYADQFGWREMEKKVAEIYKSLPPEEQAKTALIAANYGEAAALDFYGPADGLPPAISGEEQYFFWGTHDRDGSIVLAVNGAPSRWRKMCKEMRVVDIFGSPYAVFFESDQPIMICRGMNPDLPTAWQHFKSF